jgi:hypothetical protein
VIDDTFVVKTEYVLPFGTITITESVEYDDTLLE